MIDDNTEKVLPSKQYSFQELLQILVLGAIILYFGRTLFIPLSFAFLISFLLYPISRWLERKGISRSLSITLSMCLVIILVGISFFILIMQLNSFISEWEVLKTKLYNSFTELTMYISEHFNITILQQNTWLKNLAGNSGSQIIPFLSSTAYSISIYLVLAIIIPVLSALILYYRNMLLNVLYLLFPRENKKTIRDVIHETVLTYYNFIKGMVIVYLIVGILNSIGLAIIGVPYPILFGFLASILTFIPYVGILIASLLPITISWLTFNSIWYPLGVIAVFTIVQYLEANVIFPFVVSNKLKINTIATVIAILVGGILWGGAGMILFVPFMAILKLIADKTDRLKIISVLLGRGEN